MSKNGSQSTVNTLYPHPFSKAYWKQAASEFKKTKVLIFAALMIALRLILKAAAIPIAADLKINIAFFVNAYGAMVFGPVVAIVAAAITDTLGCILVPQGAYFFPFIFIEIAGSLFFALFLYRAKVSVLRVTLSRFCVDFFVNIVMNTPLMYVYYTFTLGKYYAILDIPRFVKNIVLFPIESVLLVLFLRALIPVTKQLGYIYSNAEKLKFNKRNITAMILLLVIGTGGVGGYALYHYNNTSLSASYSNAERLQKNRLMIDYVEEQNPQFEGETVVTIVESAFTKFRNPEATYSVAIYTVDQAVLDQQIADAKAEDPESTYGLETLQGYSKSKAKADAALISRGMATIVLNKHTDEFISYADDIE